MPDQWSRVDDLIVNAQYLPALSEIRSAAGVGLTEAVDIFSERYDALRIERPDDFTLPPGEYGQGVYT